MFSISARRLFFLLAGTFLLTACNQQALYSGLTEQEANEMVALMYRSDMTASKVSDSEGRFSVMTDQKAFADAVQLLQANGLPRTQFDTLGDVFKDQSFVSSSTAQRARYIHALSQEISHTISSIDGVVLSRVHLSVPERDPLSDEPAVSSASVFVKHRPNVNLSPHVGQIKALVVNGLENLPYENVTVALFESSPDQRLSAKPLIRQSAETTPLQSMSMISWLGMALIGGVLLVFFGIRMIFRRGITASPEEASPDNSSALPGAGRVIERQS